MWKRFFLPMTLLLLTVIGVTIWSASRYGMVFFENFLAQFYATVIGVIFSILFAWSFWRLQHSAQRNQLKKDLVSEARLNSERIHALEQLIHSILEKKPRELTWDDSLIKNLFEDRYRLRTAAMKNITKPENLVLVSKLDIADYLEWLLPESELYNADLARALNMLWSDRYERKDVTAAMSDLNQTMTHGILWLREAFDIIIAKEKQLLRG